MSVNVPSPTPEELLAAVSSLLMFNLSDAGYVMATGEFNRDNIITARGLRRDSIDMIKGVHVYYAGCNETEGVDEDEFYNEVHHRIKAKVFRQYQDEDVTAAETSKIWVYRTIWEIAAILRQNPSLNLGDDIDLKPIQMPEDIDEDSDKTMGTFHVGPVEIVVVHRIFAGAEC